MYKCVDCGKEFRYKSKLLDHQKENNYLKCIKCIIH